MRGEVRELVKRSVYNSPWRNAYWYARMLMNTDQYGALGKKDVLMQNLVTKVEAYLNSTTLSDEDKLTLCKRTLFDGINTSARGATKSSMLAEEFASALDPMLRTLEDVLVFTFTVRYIVLPTNDALRRVPSNDVQFCKDAAKGVLDAFGKTEAAKAITLWDELGVHGCLDAERVEIVTAYTMLQRSLAALSTDRNEIEDNLILTAFSQEFERRAGQKRKSRAGSSLEDITTFLFDYYHFSSHPTPDHFQTDIEVDKWFRCTDGWSIGISCKRTLRERWKQVSSADSNALSRFKIKEIWHITTYDRDLSDDKITMLGQQRQIFYLADSSERYKSAAAHIGMKDYVRPLSRLIDDIAAEQGKMIR